LDSQTLKAKVVFVDPDPLVRIRSVSNCEVGDMNKFSCTRSLGEEIYYATLIAENEQQAREMAIDETNKKFSKSGGRAREWSIRVLESGVEGPACIIDCGYREA
jgi:hypothetical protein